MRKQLMAFLLMVLLAAPLALPVSAQDLLCGDSTPTRYSFAVVDDEGTTGGGSSSDTATFKFRLTRDELDALRCAGSGLYLDFRFTNYEYRGDTEVTLKNGPSGSFVYMAEDSYGDPIMRVAGIDTGTLRANRTYTISVTFRMFYAYNMGNGQPHELSLEWAPGEWFAEDYLGECSDLLLDEVKVAGSTYCYARYDDDAVELGVHDFGY